MEISTIYIVGNLIVDEDSMPLKIKNELKAGFPNINFQEFDPTENLPQKNGCFIMIDTVKDVENPCVFEDIEQFVNSRAYSLHDFDLGWQLKLYKKLGMIDKIFIIGVPEKGDIKEQAEEVKKIISSLVSENE